MPYDPWADANREHWARPIQQALEHANTVLQPHGLKLLAGIDIVAIATTPDELPHADDGNVGMPDMNGKGCPKCGGIMTDISGCKRICQNCKHKDEECGA